MSNKKLSKEDIETIKKRVESGERVSDLEPVLKVN